MNELFQSISLTFSALQVQYILQKTKNCTIVHNISELTRHHFNTPQQPLQHNGTAEQRYWQNPGVVTLSVTASKIPGLCQGPNCFSKTFFYNTTTFKFREKLQLLTTKNNKQMQTWAECIFLKMYLPTIQKHSTQVVML